MVQLGLTQNSFDKTLVTTKVSLSVTTRFSQIEGRTKEKKKSVSPINGSPTNNGGRVKFFFVVVSPGKAALIKSKNYYFSFKLSFIAFPSILFFAAFHLLLAFAFHSFICSFPGFYSLHYSPLSFSPSLFTN